MGVRTLVMGIVNVTPDSFSDGGNWATTDAAVGHALALVADGADIIDVGGESTRPGSARVDAATELARVVPVVEALADRGVQVSVDTMRAEVADAVVRVGATWVNDVSGGLADPDMLATVAASGAGYIAMHWRGHSATMMQLATYDDLVADVTRELAARRDAALAAGIAPDRLVLDPGLGFSKEGDQNWELLRHVDAFEALGHPVLWGASRKRFLGPLLAGATGPREAVGRDAATAAITTLLAARGVWAVRVHDVRSSADAVRVVEAMRGPGA